MLLIGGFLRSQRKKHPSWLFFEYSRVFWSSNNMKRKSKKISEELDTLYGRLNNKEKTLADNLKGFYKDK
jgi:hypothetical protein